MPDTAAVRRQIRLTAHLTDVARYFDVIANGGADASRLTQVWTEKVMPAFGLIQGWQLDEAEIAVIEADEAVKQLEQELRRR